MGSDPWVPKLSAGGIAEELLQLHHTARAQYTAAPTSP